MILLYCSIWRSRFEPNLDKGTMIWFISYCFSGMRVRAWFVAKLRHFTGLMVR